MTHWISENLVQLASSVSASALQNGALEPIECRLHHVQEGEVRFEARWVASLELRAQARTTVSGERKAGTRKPNPFLPFEPELHVLDLDSGFESPGEASTHVVLLNKFPTVANHLLLITRAFQPQEAEPDRADFVALAKLLRGADGLGFYNGGATAGASQAHKHFQLMPHAGPLPIDPLLAQAPDAGTVPGIEFRHFFQRHQLADANDPLAGADALERCYRQAMDALGLVATDGLLPPCNLLMTRHWFLAVPRSREHWIEGDIRISVNSLGFAGCFLMRRPEWLEPMQRFGLMNILNSVTR